MSANPELLDKLRDLMQRHCFQYGDFTLSSGGKSKFYYNGKLVTLRPSGAALIGETLIDVVLASGAEAVGGPALGSGAFLNEAINQLAARYLKAAQDESGETIDPDRYQLELQRARAHFAINQSYGVDLNPTAVELAEVSLWLNCMHQGLKAPRFGARLRTGNSLIGARRATYTIEQIKKQPWKGTSNSTALPPTDQPLAEVPFGQATGIHHFLLPGEG